MSQLHPLPDEYVVAGDIVEHAMSGAIDDALDADISGACLAAVTFRHICSVLVNQFGQTPDAVGALAQAYGAAHVQASEAKSVKH